MSLRAPHATARFLVRVAMAKPKASRSVSGWRKSRQNLSFSSLPNMKNTSQRRKSTRTSLPDSESVQSYDQFSVCSLRSTRLVRSAPLPQMLPALTSSEPDFAAYVKRSHVRAPPFYKTCFECSSRCSSRFREILGGRRSASASCDSLQ